MPPPRDYKQLVVHVPQDVHTKVMQTASGLDISMAEFLRLAVMAYIEKVTQEGAPVTAVLDRVVLLEEQQKKVEAVLTSMGVWS